MDHAERTRQLETRPVGRLLWEFSIPAVAATVVNASSAIINRYFVGQTIGEVGITAVTLSMPIMTVMLAMGMMIGIGSNTLISIRLGEKKYDEAERIVGQALFLFIILSIGFMIFGLLFQEPLLRLFGASDRVMPYAKEYVSVIVCGAFLHEMSFGVNGFLRSEGKPRIAMITTLIMALLNIFFDWLFLCVFRTGIWGAGVATILAQACSTGWVFWHYISGNTLLRWRLKYIRWDPVLVSRVFLLGMPPFIMQTLNCVLQIVQMNQLSYYGDLYGKAHGIENGGDLAIGVVGIIFVISLCMFLPILGLNQGMQPIIGYNIGARRYDRVSETLRLAIRCNMIFTFFCAAWVILFPETFLRPFVDPTSSSGTELIALGSHAVRIFMTMLPAAGVVVVTAGYFQSNGMPKRAIMLTLVRQVFLLIPMLLFLPRIMQSCDGFNGLDGVWFAVPISDFLSFLPALILIVMEFTRLHKESRRVETEKEQR